MQSGIWEGANMKKLIEALHVIQDECKKYENECFDCPLFSEKCNCCCINDAQPHMWKINDEVQKALL
jgi:hypothetical protein